MCQDCHKGLSDSIVTGQLQNALEDPQFKKWSHTSLHHLYLASLGFNGKDAQVLANTLLYNYVMWASALSEVQSIDINMGTFFGPPNAKYAQDVLNCSRRIQAQFTDEGLCHEQIRLRVNSDKNIYDGPQL